MSYRELLGGNFHSAAQQEVGSHRAPPQEHRNGRMRAVKRCGHHGAFVNTRLYPARSALPDVLLVEQRWRSFCSDLSTRPKAECLHEQAPLGFKWKACKDLNGHILCPESWHFTESTNSQFVVAEAGPEGDAASFSSNPEPNFINYFLTKEDLALWGCLLSNSPGIASLEWRLLSEGPSSSSGTYHSKGSMSCFLFASEPREQLVEMVFESPEEEWEDAWRNYGATLTSSLRFGNLKRTKLSS